MKAWHFVGDTLRDGRPAPADGVELVHEGGSGNVRQRAAAWAAARDAARDAAWAAALDAARDAAWDAAWEKQNRRLVQLVVAERRKA